LPESSCLGCGVGWFVGWFWGGVGGLWVGGGWGWGGVRYSVTHNTPSSFIFIANSELVQSSLDASGLFTTGS